MPVPRGKFITLEGGEGAGKTTSSAFVARYLREQGIAVLQTREPGGTPVGEAIRAVLLNPDLPDMHADTELLLMFAARNEHLQQVIIPALQTGSWVVCDRFTDATYAYQGYGRGLPLERITQIEQWVQAGLRPDYTLLFDIDVSSGMQRVRARSAQLDTQIDRFEQEQLAFFERIRQGYLQRAANYPAQYRVIDASQPLPGVQGSLTNIMAAIVGSVGSASIEAGRAVT